MKKQANKKSVNKNLFKPRSIPFVFVSIISILLLILFGIWIWSKTNNLKAITYNQPTTQQESTPGTVEYSYNGGVPFVRKRDNDGNYTDDFKVMSVGDLHLNGEHSDFTLKVLDKFIQKEKPDLVVLDGDTVFQVRDEKWQKKLVQFFEDHKQYYTFVLGNHDCQGYERTGHTDYESRKMMFNTMCGKNLDGSGTQSQYCLASSMLESAQNGVGNHFINIKGKNGTTIQTLFMFDYYGIEHTNNEVLNWYDGSIQQIKIESGLTNSPESIAFTHKPFIEMKNPKLLPSNISYKYVSGVKHEKDSSLKESNGLVQKFLDNNTTKVIFAHNHINNVCYEATRQDDNHKLQFAYTCGLAYYCYSSRNFHPLSFFSNIAYMLDDSNYWYVDGVTNFFVKTDTPTIMHHRFSQVERIFDGLEKDLYFATQMWISYNAKGFNIANRILLPYIAGGCFAYYAFCIYFAVDGKKKANIKSKGVKK